MCAVVSKLRLRQEKLAMVTCPDREIHTYVGIRRNHEYMVHIQSSVTNAPTQRAAGGDCGRWAVGPAMRCPSHDLVHIYLSHQMVSLIRLVLPL